MLRPEQLLAGYAHGIFPMARAADDDRLEWFDPPQRGILPVGGVHMSRSLRRSLRRGGWSATITPDFDLIVSHCADRMETWINAPLRALYRALHAAGHAEALAVHHGDDLAGGVFGVTLGSAFFGESMFSTLPNGSKMALVWLSHHLHGCGFTLFDTQFLTPHLASMGGVEITRSEYHKRLGEAETHRADFYARPVPIAADLLST